MQSVVHSCFMLYEKFLIQFLNQFPAAILKQEEIYVYKSVGLL